MKKLCPGIIYGINHFGQFPSELIEWHGHNDFYKAVVNASTAWLYGASSVNCSLLGIGERTGNTPLEAMVMEYAQLRGTLDGMDATVITEIAEYYEKELDYHIPERTPFVGADFNVTRAGIHADGLAKDEEIYNIFNTAKILNRPLGVEINKNSAETLNPLRNRDTSVDRILKLMFLPFIGQDDNGKPTAGVAENWTLSEDGLTLSVQLKENLTWHDGTAVTADDVVFSFDTIAASAEDSVYYPVLNYVVSCTKTGTYSVAIRFQESFSSNLSALYFPRSHWRCASSWDRSKSTAGCAPPLSWRG